MKQQSIKQPSSGTAYDNRQHAPVLPLDVGDGEEFMEV